MRLTLNSRHLTCGLLLASGLFSLAAANDRSCIQPSSSCVTEVPCTEQFGPPKNIPTDNPGGPPKGIETTETELQETGVFVAPPRTGTTQGPTRRFAIEGMAITLPELRLGMPRIELPSLVRGRTEAKMILDQAQAPYVKTGYQQVQRKVIVHPDPAAPKSLQEKALPETCEEKLADLRGQYQQLLEKQADLEKALLNCQQNKSLSPTPAPPQNKDAAPTGIGPGGSMPYTPIPPPQHDNGASWQRTAPVQSYGPPAFYYAQPVSYQAAEPARLPPSVVAEPVPAPITPLPPVEE